jgi:hypothetical protein
MKSGLSLVVTGCTQVWCGAILLLSWTSLFAADQPGASRVTFHGYDDCLRLENKSTRVTLCPRAGGRVLEYSWKGVNALYLPPGDEGWEAQTDKDWGTMNAGRFDIGPEQTITPHPVLWSGRWQGEVIGPRSARLTSQPDAATGVQLIREFRLDEQTSRLRCRQIIKNVGTQPREYCHWSRTFAVGQGICVIPLTEPSRFPEGYVMYEPDSLINFRPRDPRIRRVDGHLVITGPPRQPKLGLDTAGGWLAYQMPNNLLFVKQYAVDPERPYNEVAGLTMSIWYPDGPMCELEPIGPRERIEPGQSAGFTETWYLAEREAPQTADLIDVPDVARQVRGLLVPESD